MKHTPGPLPVLDAYKEEHRRLNHIIAELLTALELIMPMARGYAAQNRVGRNAEMITFADDAIAKARGWKT